MPRCRGITRAGQRCKRNAVAGSEYCAVHTDQAEEATHQDGAAKGRTRGEEAPGLTAGEVLVLAGVAAVAAALLRRVLRLF